MRLRSWHVGVTIRSLVAGNASEQAIRFLNSYVIGAGCVCLQGTGATGLVHIGTDLDIFASRQVNELLSIFPRNLSVEPRITPNGMI